MTTTATRPMDALLTNALKTAGLSQTSVDTWVEADNPPTRPGPRVHFEVCVREKANGVFRGVYELCIPEEEIAAWIAARCLESKDWEFWGSSDDSGEDREQGYLKVRPFWAYGWSPGLTRRQQRQTGRTA